jgi:hypothetical protein
LKQLQEEAKLNQAEEDERLTLMGIAEIVLDMILLNEKQARTGAAEIDVFLQERTTKPLEKRIFDKLRSLKEVKRTEFY